MLNTWIDRQKTSVDPSDRERFPFDWTAFLNERGQTIGASTFDYDPSLLSHSTGRTDDTTEIELSGFVQGEEYIITNRIVTEPDELVFERSTVVVCQDR